MTACKYKNAKSLAAFITTEYRILYHTIVLYLPNFEDFSGKSGILQFKCIIKKNYTHKDITLKMYYHCLKL